MMSKSHRNVTARGANKQNKVGNTSSDVRREFQLARSALRTFVKRIVTTGSLSSNGTGYVPITTLASSNSVTALGDFSAVAGIYSNYRVKAIKLTANPFVPNYTGMTYVSPLIVLLPFRSGLLPTTFAGFVESSEAKYCTGYKGAMFSTSSKDYPDAKLWNPTNAVIAAADSFGIAVMGQNGTAGSINTYVWFYVVEYLVEFSIEN